MATTSRYATSATTPTTTSGTTNTNQSTTGSSSSNSNQSNVSSSTTNSSSTSTTNSRTQNLSNQQIAQLDLLINQLMAGGTQQMLEDRAKRQEVLNKTTQQQAAYSKEAAFGDAQGAMSQQMRLTLESLLPSINRAAAGAGTSQNSLRALLLQDAANKAAESSAALGLKASVDYGNISTNYAQVLEQLTRPDSTAINALIGAFQVAKGAVSTSQSTTNTTGTSTTNSTSDTTSNQQNSSQQNTSGTTNTTQTTGPSSGGSSSTSGGITSSGNTSNTYATPENQTNSFTAVSTGGSQGTYGQGAIYSSYDTQQFLKELYGSNRWSSYSF